MTRTDRWTEKEKEQHEKARAIAKRCAEEVPAEYTLEDLLLDDYPESFGELMAVCDEDVVERYEELETAIDNAIPGGEEVQDHLMALSDTVSEQLVAHKYAYALFADALHARRQSASTQLSPETLTRALLQTEGKFQSAHDRAVEILKRL